MAMLPDDAYHQIFGYLPRQALANCRFLNKQIGEIATYYTFRHMRLEAAYDVHKFVHVATSESLRHLVREVTIETWIGPQFKYHMNRPFRPPRDFFRALAYLRFLPSLKTLNVRFSRWCGVDDDEHDIIRTEEDNDFRYLVLDILFRSLVDEWPPANRPLREEAFVPFDVGDRGTLPPLPTEGFLEFDDDDEAAQEAISIHTLTISNLADFDDERLTESSAFKKTISSKSFTCLKLLVTTPMPSVAPEDAIRYPEKHDFFQSLPKTWLSLPVAQNLRVLSLFFRDYWGWVPRMDFRAVNSGNGTASGMPNLRVLALGNYVFSHQWQVEWIASSVGQQNGRGGLEELYLDDCPIMWQARVTEPLDDSITAYDSADSGKVEHSNAGYPLRDVILNGTNYHNAAKFAYDLRWSYILQYWKETMTSLKIFKMGHGTWGMDLIDIKMMARYGIPVPPVNVESSDPNWKQEVAQAREEADRRQQPLRDTTHLDYDCPSPPPETGYRFVHSPKHLHGVGFRHDREHVLQYIHFDIGLGPTQWVERDFGRALIEEEGPGAYFMARSKDEDAYDNLMDKVQERNRAQLY